MKRAFGADLNGVRVDASRSDGVWSIGIGLATYCNMDCSFCYSKNERTIPTQITRADIERFLSENGQWIHAINFGTGEPFLAPNLVGALELCKTYVPYAKIAITTNGSLALAADRASSEIFTYIDELDVSLDSGNRSLHDRLRGLVGAYDLALRSILRAIANDVPTTIVTVGIEETLSQQNLVDLIKLASKLGLALRLNLFRPTRSDHQLAPRYSKIKSALAMLLDRFPAVNISDPLFGSLIHDLNVSIPNHQHSLRITPDGSITPSTYLTGSIWKAASLSDQAGFVLSWIRMTLPFRRILNAPIPLACADCPIAHTCRGGSIDRRFLWYGVATERDPYCPYRYGDHVDTPPWSRSRSLYIDGPNVHQKYLPTLTFFPRDSQAQRPALGGHRRRTDEIVKWLLIKGSDVLLLLRSMNDPANPGTWDLPGGRATCGESILHAALRELQEETGLVHVEVPIAQPIAQWALASEDGSSTPGHTFVGFTDNASIRLSKEHEQFRWIRLEAVEMHLPPFLRVAAREAGSIAQTIIDARHKWATSSL